jgi:hypothetical protein
MGDTSGRASRLAGVESSEWSGGPLRRAVRVQGQSLSSGRFCRFGGSITTLARRLDIPADSPPSIAYDALLADYSRPQAHVDALERERAQRRLALSADADPVARQRAQVLWATQIAVDRKLPKPPVGASPGQLAAWHYSRNRLIHDIAAETARKLRRSVRVWRRPAAPHRLSRVRPVRRLLGARTRRNRRRTLRSRGSPGRESDDGPERGPRPRRFPVKTILLLWDAYVRPSSAWGTLERLRDDPDEFEERGA